MTRKDYIRIARALNLEYKYSAALAGNSRRTADRMDGVLYAAQRVAFALEQENPRFDRTHFLAVVRGDKSLESRPPRRKETL